jgi:flagellar protein FliO/FliZ
MRLLVRTIVLALLATYPLGLSAQVVRTPDFAPSDSRTVPTAFAQPAAAAPAAEPEPSLSPPRTSSPAGRTEPAKTSGGIQSMVTVAVSLAIVLSIFFLVVWVLRRASPGGLGTLPVEAFEVLGRSALANRQQVHLLRCGNKLLLVSVTINGAETLTEITDPAEVERLTDVCRQMRTNVAATALRRVFRPAEARNG